MDVGSERGRCGHGQGEAQSSEGEEGVDCAGALSRRGAARAQEERHGLRESLCRSLRQTGFAFCLRRIEVSMTELPEKEKTCSGLSFQPRCWILLVRIKNSELLAVKMA